MAGDERLRELEEKYEGYTVYDNAGEKIGKVDDLFVDETDHEEYIGVSMGLFGLSGTTLIPMEMVRVNERESTLEVAESRDHVKDAPDYRDDDDVTQEFEDRIRRHFGLESDESATERGSYGRSSGATAGAASAGDDARLDDRDVDDRHSGSTVGGAEDRDRATRESYRDREDMGSESAGARGATPSGGRSDLETGDRDRMGDEGHREGGDLGESGDRGRILEEGYREGYKEGYREGLREAGGRSESGDRGASGGRGDRGEPGDLGSSGATTGSRPAEEGMTRRGAGEPGDEGYRDRAGEGDRSRVEDEGFREGGPRDRDTGAEGRSGDETREMPRRSDEGEQEEGTLTKVWRRARS